MRISVKKVSVAVASCALTAGLAVSMSPAWAATSTVQSSQTKNSDAESLLGADDLEYIEKSFEKLNIPVAKQSALLEKISSGRKLDSETMKSPVNVTKALNPDGSQTVTKSWEDGSAISETVFPDNSAAASMGGFPLALPASVKGCTTKYEVGMTHKSSCQVWHQAVTWSAGFTASFRYSLSNGHYIKSISNPKTGGIGMGKGSLSYIKRSAYSSQTAKAQLKARQTVKIAGIPTSRDVGVILNVNTGGGSTSSFGS